MSDIAIGGSLGINIVGVTARVGGGASAKGISASFAGGVGKVGRTLPTLGRIKGATLVVGQVGNLKKRRRMFSNNL